MLEITKHEKLNPGSEKSFGVVFAVVFLIIALYPLIGYKDIHLIGFKDIYPLIGSKVIHLWALVVSFIFLFLAYLAPSLLSLPNKLWFKLGLLIGAIVTPIVMAIIYFSTVLPIGIGMRIFRKDLLNQQINKNKKSYWIEREKPVGPMKNQF